MNTPTTAPSNSSSHSKSVIPPNGEPISLPPRPVSEQARVAEILAPLLALQRTPNLQPGDSVLDHFRRVSDAAELLISSPDYSTLPASKKASVLIAAYNAISITGDNVRRRSISAYGPAVLDELTDAISRARTRIEAGNLREMYRYLSLAITGPSQSPG